RRHDGMHVGLEPAGWTGPLLHSDLRPRRRRRLHRREGDGDQQEVRHELPRPAASFTRFEAMSTTAVSVDPITANSADTTMKTALCHMLGIRYPIVAAPMGPDLTGPEMVAAVSNAGGLGILQAQLCAPPLFREEIHRVRALTDKPFGVNLLLHFP